ncbi:hypothetical protein COU00_00045 [Candidatus Falkowbacteria bacterium CG10_big_fil_rev_8_21_14_0_10_43_11]|uniref:NTP pyrophosphohydrolase MazG putative catalytic core domain-containing protein n=1 Tax=Candidatus Falkowbacteria bacterium CG10_big_fil_rev_8_21_14_0_10_43_11 TaxID=1974568 RepID=A0A2M6WN68_9BACT|nr:MAG: hypothetical protein COU00_00045 [Candidatus Falkowbacteria bacterium CG10_big_fil_rev_8_21_14_0_10_43_11]
MTWEELLQFIDAEDERIKAKFASYDNEKRILARTVKLGEETGELCNAVLAFLNDQRPEKLNNFKQEHLAHEFADVVITTFMLAKSAGVDVGQALKDKIGIIKNRVL